MNRVIKFRAWSDEFKMMSNPFLFESIRNSAEETGWRRAYVLLKPFDKITLRSVYLDECKVMQFTGLTDRNGMEIFEGDILKVLPEHENMNRFKNIGVVKYNEDYGGFLVEGKFNKNQHHELLTCDIAFITEVIGNIHSNPELLNP